MSSLDASLPGGADSAKRQPFFPRIVRRVRRSLTTREGLIGSYDYAFLFTPTLPFMKKSKMSSPFFGLDDPMPILLALLLGFQHALAMLAGIITPPIIMSGAGGVNLPGNIQEYLVSTSLIVSGFLSAIQIMRTKIWGTPYFLGTGLISVVGTSFSIIPVAQGAFNQMYDNGFCPTTSDGDRLPCPRGYGALVGTCAVCALIEVLIAFLPPRVLRKIFPEIVTGPTVMMIGVHLVQAGFSDWAGGAGPCSARPTDGPFRLCPAVGAPHALPWGSAEYIGLGFSVFASIIICERFGAPIMKSCSVVVGLLVGCIIAAATGYFDKSGIDSAPAVSFIWVERFELSIYAPLVLPVLAIFVICACEATGDVTATCDVSGLDVEGRDFETRIQGGILADGVNSIIAALCTITPMSVFAQNNGVIALTRCANRKAGYCCCFFLVIMGVFSKFAASLVAIPKPVLGGMTTFLFAAVAVSGIAVVSRATFTRRNRFILAAGLSLGYGSTLVPTWFSYVFTYSGDNRSLRGFMDAIVLVMETGFAITAVVCMILNLILREDEEERRMIEDRWRKRDDRRRNGENGEGEADTYGEASTVGYAEKLMRKASPFEPAAVGDGTEGINAVQPSVAAVQTKNNSSVGWKGRDRSGKDVQV